MATNTRAASPTSTSNPLALTTVFTPPPTCLDIVTYDGTTAWQNGLSQSNDPDCYPSSFRSLYNSYYSPGVCPHSWYSASSLDPETADFDAMCCPSSYFLVQSATGLLRNVCASIVNSDLTNVFSTSTLESGALPQSPHLITLPKASLKENTVFADVIQIKWDSDDSNVIKLMSATTSSSSTSSQASPSPAPGATTTNRQPTSTSSPSPIPTTSSGLSSGAKAGIGVGVALGVIAVAAVAAFLFLRRRKSPQRVPTEEDVKMEPAYTELHQYDNSANPAEMDARIINEMPGTLVRAELNAQSPRQEKRRSAIGSDTG